MPDLIAPPPELVKQWKENWYRSKVKHTEIYSFLATCGAQWGADQELQACCDWFIQSGWHPDHPAKLRAARRPKPSSLKEQALKALEDDDIDVYLIRRALEALPDA